MICCSVYVRVVCWILESSIYSVWSFTIKKWDSSIVILKYFVKISWQHHIKQHVVRDLVLTYILFNIFFIIIYFIDFLNWMSLMKIFYNESLMKLFPFEKSGTRHLVAHFLKDLATIHQNSKNFNKFSTVTTKLRLMEVFLA